MLLYFNVVESVMKPLNGTSAFSLYVIGQAAFECGVS